MKLTVQRTSYATDAVEGIIQSDDGTYADVTLEPAAQAAGSTVKPRAIPAGTYNVECTYSPHFARMMPLLDAVPDFEAVRIHYGNTPADTDGCILVGTTASSPDFITESQAAFALLWPKISAACQPGAEGCSITIIDGPGAHDQLARQIHCRHRALV